MNSQTPLEPEELTRLADGAADPVHEKLADALTPGYQAEFDPEEAERAGAFAEDALTEQDAAASSEDLAAALADDEPAFLVGDGTGTGIPPFITPPACLPGACTTVHGCSRPLRK